jgi:hypothetical protein
MKTKKLKSDRSLRAKLRSPGGYARRTNGLGKV